MISSLPLSAVLSLLFLKLLIFISKWNNLLVWQRPLHSYWSCGEDKGVVFSHWLYEASLSVWCLLLHFSPCKPSVTIMCCPDTHNISWLQLRPALLYLLQTISMVIVIHSLYNVIRVSNKSIHTCHMFSDYINWLLIYQEYIIHTVSHGIKRIELVRQLTLDQMISLTCKPKEKPISVDIVNLFDV